MSTTMVSRAPAATLAQFLTLALTMALAPGCGQRPHPRTLAEGSPHTLAATGGASAVDVTGDESALFAIGDFLGQLEGRPASHGGAFVDRLGGGSEKGAWPVVVATEGDETVHATAIASRSGRVVAVVTRTSALRPPRSEVIALDARSGAESWRFALAAASGYATAAAVTITGAGDVIVAGSFSGTLQATPTPLTAAGLGDGFILALDAAGKPRWTRRFGGPGRDGAAALAWSPDVGIVVAGTIAGAAQLARATVASRAHSIDVLVARLREDGAVVWVKSLGGPGTDTASDVLVHDGTIELLGTFDADVLAGSAVLSSHGSSDLMLVGIDGEGTMSGARAIGTADADVAIGLADTGDGLVAVGSRPAAPAYFYTVVRPAPGGTPGPADAPPRPGPPTGLVPIRGATTIRGVGGTTRAAFAGRAGQRAWIAVP